jgi:hypothetical protein
VPSTANKLGGMEINPQTGEHRAAMNYQRMTLHWSLIDVIPNAGYRIGDTLMHGTKAWGDKGPKYILIEPLSFVKHLIVGGWIDDLYIIGPHTPTSTSILIAPAAEESSIMEQGFLGSILTYDLNLSTSEEEFAKYTKSKIENIVLQVSFPLDSNLERMESQFGTEVTNLLKNAKGYCEIEATFPRADGNKTPIFFQKTNSAYVFSTNRAGMDLCSALTEISRISLPMDPGQLIVRSSSEKITLKEFFMTAPWMHLCHASSPFSAIEEAVSIGDFEHVKSIMEQIRISLVPESETYFRFITFKAVLEAFYNVSLSTVKTEVNPELSKICEDESVNMQKTPGAAILTAASKFTLFAAEKLGSLCSSHYKIGKKREQRLMHAASAIPMRF